jgi:hypothetical protein
MPITQITLENFKGVANTVTVPLRPITLLFGANSAGKSTLLQALLYLRELLENQNADADVLTASGNSINLGGFRQFVHGHDLSRTVRIGVTVTVDDDGLPLYFVKPEADDPVNLILSDEALPGVRTAGITLSIQWYKGTSLPYVTGYEVFINGASIGKIEAEPPPMIATLRVEEEHPIFRGLWPQEPDEYEEHQEYDNEKWREIVSPLGYFMGAELKVGNSVVPKVGEAYDQLSPSGTNESVFLTKTEANRLFSHIFVGAGELVLRELQRIRYIGPIREVPNRSFAPQRTPDQSRWADGSAAWDWVHLKPEFVTASTAKELRNLGLGYRIEPHRTFGVSADSRLGVLIERARLGDAEAFEDLASLPTGEVMQIEEHSRVRIVAEETGVEVAPCDIGVGVAQVLPVIIGSMVPGYSVLAVEQPELHLHPAVQCRLADVFVRACRTTEERLTLLETHSEHLMLRLMRRIRETANGNLPELDLTLTKDDVQVIFVESFEGRTVFREMPLNSQGEWVKNWPGGFFDEDIEELF